MPFKKFRKYKKTFRKNNRPFKKYTGRFIKAGKTIHYFKRTFKQVVNLTELFTVINPDGSDVNSFKLSLLPNYSDFTSLYDEYKVCGISRKYLYEVNTANTGTYALPRLITVNDWNDQVAPANENEMLEYGSCKQSRLDKPVKRYFKPRFDNTSGYQFQKWLSTQFFTIALRGLKEAVISSTTEDIGNVQIYTTFYIACRNSR